MGDRRRHKTPASAPLLGALAESLARSDSLMRRLIPGLAIIFIVILALFRTGDLVSDYTRTQENAQVTLSLMATVVASGLMSSENDLPETGYRTTLKRILADSLPTGATSKGRIYLVADQSGTIVAPAPLQPCLKAGRSAISLARHSRSWCLAPVPA